MDFPPARRPLRAGLLVLSAALAIAATACASSTTTGATPASGAATVALPSPTRAALAPAAAPASPTATAQASLLQVKDDPTLGRFFVDSSGRTLYRFTRDTPNTSVCNDACAQTWPPLGPPPGDRLVAPAGVTGTLSLITRADNSRQVAYNGTPLYYYRNDTAPGQTNGQGVGGVWFVVNP
jgi:predicted lipoprotein with Yx(FWY)xxD motif